MPIFVAHDSVDVWAHRELYTLDEKGAVEFQAGVPPDYFSETGQLWGNPLYRWDVIAEGKYKMMTDRFRHLFSMMDWVRIDHFRGFEAYWKIPAGEETAINGEWEKGPGEALFKEIQKELGNLPIIAEDLGLITPEVEELRDNLNFPGMRVLQFAFGGDADNTHLPHNYIQNCIAYTGTHDNDTLRGWWENHATDKDRKMLTEYFALNDGSQFKKIIAGLYRSVANLAIIPLQDVIEQGSEGRVNTPSVPEGNWQYVIPDNALSEDNSVRLQRLCEVYGRLPKFSVNSDTA